MNPFKVGDRVKCIAKDDVNKKKNSPKIGEEFVITCVDEFGIGFASTYPKYAIYKRKEIREGKLAQWFYFDYELIEAVEDMSFNKQLKEITDESV